MKSAKRLFKIFISTLYLSAFTFGGGYVIVTLLKQKFARDPEELYRAILSGPVMSQM